MDPGVTELMHWIPTPLLALGFWALMKKAFTDHEEKFSTLVTRFEKAVAKLDDHHIDIVVLKRDVEALKNETIYNRKRTHDLADFITELQSKLLVEGSGPKRDPRSGHHDG